MLQTTRTCPWWLAPGFDNPLRRLIQPADKILEGMLESGQSALDVGCGMGYFTLELARRAGPQGVVYAVDLQPRMLSAARQRAQRAGLEERIRFVQCTPDQIGVAGPVDFALAFWMVHETNNQRRFLEQVAATLRSGGRFLLVEPRIHVGASAFERTTALAREAGFLQIGRHPVRLSRSMLFER